MKDLSVLSPALREQLTKKGYWELSTEQRVQSQSEFIKNVKKLTPLMSSEQTRAAWRSVRGGGNG